MCDPNANTTTTSSTTSLPGGLTNAINSASTGALAAYNAGNPTTAIGPAPVAPLNTFQNQAANTTAGLAGYTPQSIGANYSAQTVTPGSVTQFGSPTVSGSQIQSYMNPYTSSVIGTSLDELNRQLATTNQAASGSAASAGAFGGDRAAIVQSENARNADQIAAQTISGLNSQNYTQASGLAEQDASRALQAGTAQSQLDASTGEANQYADLQAANLNSSNERANQSAGLQGAQLDLQAAQQEGNLGAQFRQASQDNLTSGYNQAYTNAYWPISSVSTLAGQLGTLANAAPKTTTGVTVAPGQSTTGQIAGLGTAALGLNSLIPGGLASGVKSLFGGSSAVTNLSNTSDLSAVANASDADFLNDGQSFYDSLDGFARGGLAGYADGGDINAANPQSVPGVVNFSNPALQTDDDPSVLAARRLADRNQALFAGAQQDATALTAGDAQNAGLSPADAAQMAAARVALTNGMNQADSDKLHQALRLSVGLQAIPDQTASPPVADPASAPPAVNTGLAAAAQGVSAEADPAATSAVNAAIAVNPAAMVTSQLGAGPLPVDQMPAPPPDGLAAAAVPMQGGDIPTPPIPPAQGGLADAAPTRMDRSANPSSPIPTGGFGAPDPADAGQSGGGQQNKTGMALLAAGLGMMASKSHTALGAIGDGGLAGVQQYDTMQQQENQNALRRATLANQQSYQQAMVGVRQQVATTGQQKADTGQQRVDQQGSHYDAQDAATQARSDAYVQRAMAQAAKAGQQTPATAQQSAMAAFQQANPGATAADAWNYIKGYASRDAIAAGRLGLQQQAQANTQDWRAWQQQSKATDQETSAARSVMFNATNLGKPMSMDQALAQVRGARSNAGPTPIVGQPVQQPAPAPAAAPASSGGRQANSGEIAGAQAAIARGVPRAVIMARFQQANVIPAGL